MRVVHKLQPLSECEVASHDTVGSLIFEMSDTDEPPSPTDLQDAARRKSRLDWLLTPPDGLGQVASTLECTPPRDMPALLRNLGYAVKIATTAGGGPLHPCHSFLTVRLSDSSRDGQDVIIDPFFADQFAVAYPTPRYTLIQSALPRVLVATPRSVLQAIMLMADELARVFEVQGYPLPPWRKLVSLVAKYDATHSITVVGDLQLDCYNIWVPQSSANAVESSADVSGVVVATHTAEGHWQAVLATSPAACAACTCLAAIDSRACTTQQAQQRIARKLVLTWGMQQHELQLPGTTASPNTARRASAGTAQLFCRSAQQPVRVCLGFKVAAEAAGLCSPGKQLASKGDQEAGLLCNVARRACSAGARAAE